MDERETQAALQAHLRACTLCGNVCGADRMAGEPSVCGAGLRAEVSHVAIHHGEEPPLSGTRGCGNIFFHNCSLSCVYCQNWQISNADAVPFRELTAVQLTFEMLRLQEAGVHTLGLVAPTSHLPTVVPALQLARKQGLAIPVVYNSSGFDTLSTIRLLDGLVDVYLPDLKYGTDESARVYSGVNNYVATSRETVLEMVRQVGGLVVGGDGIARRGVIVRHLVLPGGVSDSVDVLSWIARELPRDVPVSLMSQYKPAYQAAEGFFPELGRPLTVREYEYYLAVADELGLDYLFTQDPESANGYNPDFGREDPFGDPS